MLFLPLLARLGMGRSRTLFPIDESWAPATRKTGKYPKADLSWTQFGEPISGYLDKLIPEAISARGKKGNKEQQRPTLFVLVMFRVLLKQRVSTCSFLGDLPRTHRIASLESFLCELPNILTDKTET